MNKVINYLEDDNWYKIFDVEIEKDIEYKLLEREEVQTLLKEIKRLNNIIKELQRRERQLSFIKIRKQP